MSDSQERCGTGKYITGLSLREYHQSGVLKVLGRTSPRQAILPTFRNPQIGSPVVEGKHIDLLI